MPGLRTGDQDRSQQPGRWPGQDWEEGRTVTTQVRAIACERTVREVDELVYAVQSEVAEAPLLINGDWSLYCRPRRREIVQNGSRFETFVEATIQWEATDPRIYGRWDQQTVYLAGGAGEGRQYEPRPGSGWSTGWWGAAIGSGYAREYRMPGDAGTAQTGWQYVGAARPEGFINARNSGVRPSWRIHARITGPILNPQLVHKGRERLELQLQLRALESIEIDWWDGTILMEDQSRYLSLSTGSRWWPLDPGDNEIRFLAAEVTTGASVVFRWRSAW
jgi:hypothetical protein